MCVHVCLYPHTTPPLPHTHARAHTQARECLLALKSPLGTKPEVPIGTLASAISDNASSAVGTSRLLVEEKRARAIGPRTQQQQQQHGSMIADKKATVAAFRVRRSTNPSSRRQQQQTRKRPGRRERANSPAERDETEDERALIGRGFVDEGVDWRVLEVGWDQAAKTIVVWYYDVEMCGDMSEEELKEDLDHDAVEHSSVSEVTEWIAASGA